MARFLVGNASKVEEGKVIVVRAGDRRLALSMVEGKYYAIDDVCTHDSGPLGEGVLCDYSVECPRHGARFDIRTGQALSLPATQGVSSYPVTIDGDDIYVELPD
ncbi:MAG: non-heme iron oxygenase ferredoxin subunit [bacterium]